MIENSKERLMRAVALIDEEFISEAQEPYTRVRPMLLKRLPTIAAAVLVCLILAFAARNIFPPIFEGSGEMGGDMSPPTSDGGMSGGSSSSRPRPMEIISATGESNSFTFKISVFTSLDDVTVFTKFSSSDLSESFLASTSKDSDLYREDFAPKMILDGAEVEKLSFDSPGEYELVLDYSGIPSGYFIDGSILIDDCKYIF